MIETYQSSNDISFGDVFKFVKDCYYKGMRIPKGTLATVNFSISSPVTFSIPYKGYWTVKVNEVMVQVREDDIVFHASLKDCLKVGTVVSFYNMGKKVKGVIENLENTKEAKIITGHNCYVVLPLTRLSLLLPRTKDWSYVKKD